MGDYVPEVKNERGQGFAFLTHESQDDLKLAQDMSMPIEHFMGEWVPHVDWHALEPDGIYRTAKP